MGHAEKRLLASLAAAVLFACSGASGCGGREAEEEERLEQQRQALEGGDGDGGGACRFVALVASKTYGPSQWSDASERFAPELRFTLPAAVPVTAGNAGNHWITVTYARGAGSAVSCRYVGGASQAHPNSAAQIALGLRYVLQSCSDGGVAGAVVVADRVTVHVDNGDSYKTPTTVRLALDEAEPCASADGGGASDAAAAVDARAADGSAIDASPPADSGSCAPGQCDDGQPCTLDLCGPSGCTHVPVTNGTSCGGTFCSGLAACAAGACVAGPPPTDPNPSACTTSVCDDAARAFTHPPRPDGTLCLDDTVCNGSESCRDGTCAAGVPLLVADGNVCTVDACSAAGGVTHTPIAGCDPTPVQGDAPFETRASVLGRLVSSTGAAITGASFAVYDERASGAPRGDVVATVAADGSFRLKLTAFPEAEPERAAPHHLHVVIDAPGTLRAHREGYAHPGATIDLGNVRLVGRDPKITTIGPAGGTASDSQGLVELVVPAGALATAVPIQITPLRQRADFPSPLPSSTITMYGFELEPSGTTFAAPATVRVANYRNLPTTLAIPVGSFDPVEGRWEHEATASWDGARFAAPIAHFSTWDCNAGEVGDLVATITTSPNPNKSGAICGAGSSWRGGGGSIDQAIPIPGVRVRGEDVALSLSYASGLAGSRKLGARPDTTAGPGAVPRGSLGVSAPGVKVKVECVGRGAGGSTEPGTCSSVVGRCGFGGAQSTSMTAQLAMLGRTIEDAQALANNAKEAEFGGWVDIPLTSPGEVAETGLVTQQVSVASNALSACASTGGIFGVSDPLLPRVQVTGVDIGPYVAASRKVLLHHRFSSPYGAGWAIREISRLYSDGDVAYLVAGDGQEEEFRPRARLAPARDALGQHVLGRDPRTGELFAAIDSGRIARLDPLTGATTNVLAGVAFGGARLHALAIAYVGGARHFVVATSTALLDVGAGGATQTLTTRESSLGDAFQTQASVAAKDSDVFYTDGDDGLPLLYRFRLAAGVAVPEVLSATAGDTRLHPRQALGAVKFDGPRGLAIALDGALLVAEPRRHVVYAVDPDVNGVIGIASRVRVALGMGAARYVPAIGERQPALAYPINQPARLAVGEDGVVLVMTSYGVTSFDPVAREAELLFYHGGRDEVVASLTEAAGPTSIAAITSTAFFSTSSAGLVRVDVERSASREDPTRTLRRLPGGGSELTDTTAAAVWRFDAGGRLLEQRKRTGERDFTVEYVDAAGTRGQIARVVDAVGGAYVLGYAGNKLETIADPQGRLTRFVVDGSGDLVSMVEPDGETHRFTYDGHRMVTKTSPRGDVTTYGYDANGVIATSSKPGGENYAFEAALSSPPSYDASGATVRTGAVTDARGVRRAFRTDIFGRIEEETFAADGVTRTVSSVHPATIGSADEPPAAARNNTFRRTSHQTVNGAPLTPPLEFDSFGRAVRQVKGGAGTAHLWTYGEDGWLASFFAGPSNDTQRIERDAAGHVTRIFDVEGAGAGTATGREMRFTWRSDGQPATMTEHGVTSTFSYDDAGARNLTGVADTLGRSVSLTYDAYGNVASTTDGTASASFTFDVGNRLRTSRDGLGNATELRYEQVGCGCSERDEVAGIHTPDLPAGVEWTMSYGPQGRLAGVTDPYGFTESYTYEPTGEVKTVRDRLARTTTLRHDALGRMLSLVDTLGRTHTRSYAVPVGGGWSGPTLSAGSGDGSAATTSLSSALRSGDYQIGVNAHAVEGYPAQIALYRDATFALGYTRYFDEASRLTARTDRASQSLESTAIPQRDVTGAYVQEAFAYDLRTSAPVVTSAAASRADGGYESSSIVRDVELDAARSVGFAPGVPVTSNIARDVGGRVTSRTDTFEVPTLSFPWRSYDATYTYFPDGRLASVSNADGASRVHILLTDEVVRIAGSHTFTYDARGLLATQTDFDGVYRYAYDALGRSTRLTYPDGHVRVQVFDDLGRITSRCYAYPGDASLDRCYAASYDAVGNPVRLVDPEGSDAYVYDALDHLTKVTRRDSGGVVLGVEDYAYNALGALRLHAGAVVDHQRPRLAGGGSADAAVPATLDAQPVVLDGGGRVTSLRGAALAWSKNGQLRGASAPVPVPASPLTFGFDAAMRRAWTEGQADTELYHYEGPHRIAAIVPKDLPADQLTFLFDGIDHPLRLGGTRIRDIGPPSPAAREQGPVAVAYYELDLAGNVRRLRARDGRDLGGYRYTAFGETLEDTVQRLVIPNTYGGDNRKQPLRWKGMWRFDVGGTELYDARARMWSPALGSFLSVDEYAFHDPTSTLWAWPNQNPITFSDPFGRDGTTSNPIQDLVDSGFLPPGLTVFGKGTRLRATGISMMANDATFEAGMAKMNCGNAMIAAGAGVLAADAQVLVGAAQGVAMAIKGGGNAITVRSGSGNLAKSGDLTLVSRWGREGLQSGDWVMKGEANWSNYILSGKFDPGPWNQFAPFSSGAEYLVPGSSLYWPPGWEVFNGLLGQRIYLP